MAARTQVSLKSTMVTMGWPALSDFAFTGGAHRNRAAHRRVNLGVSEPNLGLLELGFGVVEMAARGAHGALRGMRLIDIGDRGIQVGLAPRSPDLSATAPSLVAPSDCFPPAPGPGRRRRLASRVRWCGGCHSRCVAGWPRPAPVGRASIAVSPVRSRRCWKSIRGWPSGGLHLANLVLVAVDGGGRGAAPELPVPTGRVRRSGRLASPACLHRPAVWRSGLGSAG